MSRVRSTWVMMAVCLGGVLFVTQLHAQTNTMPPVPYVKSPVDLFRDLLTMSPGDRKNFLTNRPPETRARILDKLKEYEALDANERELRLRATELRWYLPPLMRLTPANRATRLATIPPDMRALVEDRLAQWDLLPPPLQQELLDNEQTLRLFTHVDIGSGWHDWHRATTNHFSWEDDLARWNAMPEEKRRSLGEQFSRFFELTESEKNKTLNTLSDAEKRQMQTTLQAFEKLPPVQRIKCIRSFQQFSTMSAPERYAFLKNAERWSKMSPDQRKVWRDLVARVPQWPPLPPGMRQSGSPALPPMPQAQPKTRTGTALATNTN